MSEKNMTQNIDTKALQEAINEIKDEHFQQQMREWLVMGAPPEVTEIWKRYCDKVEEEEIIARKQLVLMGWTCVLFLVVGVVWSTARIVFMAGCVR